jgi:membrane fusion protein (multidrug efflux system)
VTPVSLDEQDQATHLEPGTREPGTREPGTREPGRREPGTREPGTREPGTREPGTREPGRHEPGTREPGTRAEEQSPDRRQEEGERKASEPTQAGKPPENKPPEKKKSSMVPRTVGILALILVIAGGIYYYISTRDIESTDDAYTDGRALTISPHIPGYVVALLVNDNEQVKAGEVLARIDPRDYIIARDQARASLVQVEARKRAAEYGTQVARKNFPARLLQAQGQLVQARGQLFQAETDYKRQHAVSRAATTQQNVDQSTAALQQAQGQVTASEAAVQQAEPVEQNIGQQDEQVSELEGEVQEAKAKLAQAELNLSYTNIIAPQDGWITKRNIEVGNYLQTGASIFSIVTPEVWVTANFKESQLDRMLPGQKVTFSVDAYPDLKLEGHVDSIQLGSGSRFTAFPPENATGNFVKIVQRVPVKLIIDRGMDPKRPLPLGISVVPTVSLK